MNFGTTYYYPTPLEEFDSSEQELVAKARMDSYIEQNSFGNGIASGNISSAADVKSRVDRISYCRALWNNTLDESRFNYLYNKIEKHVQDDNTGIDEVLTMEMPAKVRHIPIVRNKLHALISKEMSRPLITKTVATDLDAIDHKLEKKKDKMLEAEYAKMRQRQLAANTIQQLVATQQQMMQEMAQDPSAQTMIMEMQAQIEQLQLVINKEARLSETDVKKISEYYNYSYKTMEEDICSKALQSYIDEQRVRHKMNDSFEEQMVTGEPIWFCHWEPGEQEPELRNVRPEYVWYQYNESAKFLSELDWIVEYMPMSIGMVISYFGKDMTSEQLEQVRNMQPSSYSANWYNTNLTYFPDGRPSGYGIGSEYDNLLSHEVECYRVFWKEQTEVWAMFSENNHETPYFSKKPPFVKFITAEEAKNMMSTKAKKDRLKRQGKTIKRAYRVDLYEGVRVGAAREGLYFKVGKSGFQYRISNKISDVPNPYIGFNSNSKNQPYSPIWETKDIQELYNILHYQEELLIALSGVKGTVYDISQMPTGMTPQEVMYYKKNGALFIETLFDNGKPKRSSFNQFSNYDDTVSPAISFLTQIKQSLVDLVGEITGVTRQQTGQVAATDQVGTTQIALQQSNVVTEYYFLRHEELVEQVLTRLSNIFPYAYAEGKKGVYILGKERQEILNIQKNQLKGEFRTMVNSGSKEREIMSQAKQMATMKFQANSISASQLIDILNIDTMFEMQKKLKEYEDETLARMERMSQQNMEQQKQAQMEMKQLEMQMAQQMAQINGQMESQLLQLQGQIDMQRDQIKLQVAAQEIAVKQELDQAKIANERYKIDTEAAIETAYLEFQYNELQVNQQTQRAQMLINKAKTQLDISKSRSKQKLKD